VGDLTQLCQSYHANFEEVFIQRIKFLYHKILLIQHEITSLYYITVATGSLCMHNHMNVIYLPLFSRCTCIPPASASSRDCMCIAESCSSGSKASSRISMSLHADHYLPRGPSHRSCKLPTDNIRMKHKLLPSIVRVANAIL
jgi:hypothetical protein